jgi:hypothetical protein
MAIGSIWLLAVAFEQETAWGVACLLLPPVSLVFAVKYWNRAYRPVAVWIGGFLGLIIVKLFRDGTIL